MVRPLIQLSLGLLLVAFSGLLIRADEEELRKKALSLNNITGEKAILGKIGELRKDKSGLKALLGVAATMAKEKDQPFNYTGAFILARAAQLIKEYDAAETLYKVCVAEAIKLKSGNKISQVLEGVIELYAAKKNYADAIAACQEFLDLKGDKDLERIKPFVMERMIELMARDKNYDEALKLTEKLIEADEGGWYFVRLKADVLRQSGKLEDAVKTYEEVLEKLKESKVTDETKDRYADQCRYVLSNIYVDLNKIDKSVEELEGLIKRRPDNSTFYNDLGYVLADHDMKFDEAEKLVRKAIDLDRDQRKKWLDEGLISKDEDKDNAAYLDSLAWVMFKKKNYPEAKKLLLESVKGEEGQHVEIYDHLGDVHMVLGEKSDAVKTWQKALKLEVLSRRDESRKGEIKKKIEQAEK